ncbi:MAG: VOC family protein [Dehalococcoidales bacterium]|jgi:methylmalonyl-CoA/ethylmalonyl-CoA epimerase|nr:VOC family protein [Dehalococcoidales bacterium]
MSAEKDAVALPAPSHIGLVVKDLDKTLKFLSSLWGLGPWQSFEYAPSQEELTVGKPFRQKIAHASLGTMALEVVQQLEGGGPWRDFMDTNGEGIHHIAFSLSNYDEMMAHMKARGCQMVAGGLFQGKRWSYFATEPGGMVVEFGEA